MEARSFWTALGTLVVLAIVIAVVEALVNRSSPICIGRQTELDVFEGRMLDLLEEVVKLLISIAFLVLGAIGAALLRGVDRSFEHKSVSIWLLVGGGVAAALSLYYGYVGRMRVLEMLNGHCAELQSPQLVWPHFLQFYALMGSVLLLLGALMTSTPQGRSEGPR